MTEATGRIDLNNVDLSNEDTRDNAGAILDQLEAQGQMDSLRGRSNASPTSKPDAAGDTGNGLGDKRAGYDSVLRYLEENEGTLPGGAEAFRELQRSVSRTGNRNSEVNQENAELRERMARVEGRLSHNQSPSRTGDPELEKLRKSLSNRDRQIFGLLKEEAGLLTKEEWANSTQSQREQEISMSEAEEGVNMYGSHFGGVANGSFEWNPDIQERVEGQIQRLTEDVGVTPLAAYRLEFFDQLMDAAFEKGKQERMQNDDQRAVGRISATTMTRGGGGPSTTPNIYKSGDKAGDVLDRSYLLAKQKQSRRSV